MQDAWMIGSLVVLMHPLDVQSAIPMGADLGLVLAISAEYGSIGTG